MKKDRAGKNMQKQTQELKQKLSPAQVLKIKITQSARLELQHLIYEKLETNPMLEFLPEEEPNESPYDEGEEEIEEEVEFEEELKDFFNEDFPTYFSPTEVEEQPRSQIPYVSTLSEELKSELRMESSDEDTIKIGEYIIESLNEKGYLEIPVEGMTEYFNTSKEKIEEILRLVQKIGPPGIAARDEKEALFLKLERRERDWEREIKIVNNYWEEFKGRQIEKVSDSLDLSEEEVRESFRRIQNLCETSNLSSHGEIKYVTPSVVVTRKKDGFDIAINEPELPFLRLNTKYLRILRTPENYDKETVEFVKKWMENAKLLLQSLEERKKNFRRVMKYIIEKQKKFLEQGVLHMKPLKLKEIAEATDISISTVSRYLKDTYIQTHRGVFHSKYLLSGGVESTEGKISTNSIKEKIRRMIKREGDKPYRDKDIQDILKKEGINIKRRTITKYRNQMDIPSRTERKKEKRLNEQ